MRTVGRALVGLTILVIAVAAVTGCAATSPSASSAVLASTSAVPATGAGSITSAIAPSAISSTTAPLAVDGQRGRPAAGATTPGLPADWPADLPLPHGTLTGATGSNGLWTAQFLVLGSAADVRQATVDSYLAAGFTAVSDSVLNKGNRQITLAVENRDHSAGETTLLIQVTTI